jgi:hypothetical protein
LSGEEQSRGRNPFLKKKSFYDTKVPSQIIKTERGGGRTSFRRKGDFGVSNLSELKERRRKGRLFLERGEFHEKR